MTLVWKPGRGTLGPFKPLFGSWQATAPRPDTGKLIRCTRSFAPQWKTYVRLDARWELAPGNIYEEIALFGRDRAGSLRFWSFTSDGRQSQGERSDGSDVHPLAIAFVAEMPAGTGRFLYWPDPGEGFRFAVENRTKKGWNRFVEHHYLPATD